MSSWRSSVETIRLGTTAQGARGASAPLHSPSLAATSPHRCSAPPRALQRTTHRGTSAAYLRYFFPNRCSSAASSNGIWHLSIARTNAPAGSSARGEPSQSACAQSSPAPARYSGLRVEANGPVVTRCELASGVCGSTVVCALVSSCTPRAISATDAPATAMLRSRRGTVQHRPLPVRAPRPRRHPLACLRRPAAACPLLPAASLSPPVTSSLSPESSSALDGPACSSLPRARLRCPEVSRRCIRAAPASNTGDAGNRRPPACSPGRRHVVDADMRIPPSLGWPQGTCCHRLSNPALARSARPHAREPGDSPAPSCRGVASRDLLPSAREPGACAVRPATRAGARGQPGALLAPARPHPRALRDPYCTEKLPGLGNLASWPDLQSSSSALWRISQP